MADLAASLARRSRSSASSIADYGSASQVTRGGEGIATRRSRPCRGGRNAYTGARRHRRSAPVARRRPRGRPRVLPRRSTKPSSTVTQWRVTRGIRDSANRDSLWFADATPVTIGQKYHFKFPTMPTEHASRPATRSGSSSAARTRSMASGTGTTTSPSRSTPARRRSRSRSRRLRRDCGGGPDRRRDGRAGPRRRPGRHHDRHDGPDRHAVNYTLRPRPTTRIRTRSSRATRPRAPSSPLGTTHGHLHRQATPTATLRGEDLQRRRPSRRPGRRHVGGTVAATLSLSLGAPAPFGAFTPAFRRPTWPRPRPRPLDRG